MIGEALPKYITIIFFSISVAVVFVFLPTLNNAHAQDTGSRSLTEEPSSEGSSGSIDATTPVGTDNETAENPADGNTNDEEAEPKTLTGVDIPGQSEPITSYHDYMTTMLDFAKNLGLALAILMLIYAGYKYMTSQGNPTAINEAKDIVIGALSGFALLFLIYLLINVLNITL